MATAQHDSAAYVAIGGLPVPVTGDGDRDRDTSINVWSVRSRFPTRIHLSPIVSGALVVVLMVAIVAGYSGISRLVGPGKGNDSPASITASSALAEVPVLPKPENCRTRDLSDAEKQKIYTAPYEQRTYELTRKPVDAVEGAQILQVYEQIRDCSVVFGPSVYSPLPLLSTHAIQWFYWRTAALIGGFDTRTSEPGPASATPPLFVPGSVMNPGGTPVPNSGFVWQPDISKTDTYFAEIHVDSMRMLKDGRVYVPLGWVNAEGQPNAGPPLTALVFIKIDGQWKLDDWIFGAAPPEASTK